MAVPSIGTRSHLAAVSSATTTPLDKRSDFHDLWARNAIQCVSKRVWFKDFWQFARNRSDFNFCEGLSLLFIIRFVADFRTSINVNQNAENAFSDSQIIIIINNKIIGLDEKKFVVIYSIHRGKKNDLFQLQHLNLHHLQRELSHFELHSVLYSLCMGEGNLSLQNATEDWTKNKKKMTTKACSAMQIRPV